MKTLALRFRDWPLRWKMLALLLPASALPIAVAVALEFVSARRLMHDQTARSLSTWADDVAGDIEEMHRAHLAVVRGLAALPTVVEFCGAGPTPPAPVRQQAQAVLDAFVRKDASMRGIGIVDAAGMTRLATEASLVGMDLRFRSYVQQVLHGEELTSDVYVSVPEVGSVPSVAYACPVRDAGGRVLGAMCLWVQANDLWKTMGDGNERAGPGSYSVLFDRYGIRIAHTARADFVFHPAGTLDPATIDALVAEGRFGAKTRALLTAPVPHAEFFEVARARTIAADGQVLRGTSRVVDAPAFYVPHRLRTVPWTVIYVVPVATVERPVTQLVNETLIASSAIILAALLTGALLMGRLLRRIRLLATGTEALARGDLSARVPDPLRDELGVLAARFNQMAEALAASRNNLEAKVAERTEALARANRELSAQAEELRARGMELSARQEELEQKNREVERVNSMKSQFLANLSHELRTPLNAVIGFAQLLLERPAIAPDQAGHVREILAAAYRLLELINELLDLARLEAGRATLALEPVAPAAVIALAWEQVRLQAEPRRITLRSAVATGRLVLADQVRLRRILVHLLTNAVKFGPEGSVVEVGAEDQGALVRFRVRDEGPGIPEALLPQLFQPFVQGETSLSRTHGGAGIGLALSRRMVEQHGGTIEVESGPTDGATFRFTLPAAGPGAGPAPSDSLHG